MIDPSVDGVGGSASTGSAPIARGMIRVPAALLVLGATLLALAVSPAPASAARPVLGVDQGRIVDRANGIGQPIQLRGVNRSGTEYACTSASDGTPGKRGYAIFDGPTYDSRKDVAQPPEVLDRMQAWGVNAVRIPLSDACWFGEQNAALNTRYAGDAYRNAIMTFVRQLADRGMVAILSLHVASTTPASNLGPQDGGRPVLLPMPQAQQGPRFWKHVVQELGKIQARNVVYDVFNEPHLEDAVFPPGEPRDDWGCWREGCTLVDPTTAVGAPVTTYASAGMEDLVDAIREQESNTGFGSLPGPIMLGGVDYANDLSEWTSHLPADPKNALVASFHLYGGGDGTAPFSPAAPDGGGGVRPGTACNDVPCWLRTVGTIASGSGGVDPRAVVTGEVGQYDCRSRFTRQYASWADGPSPDAPGARPISYLAWTWNAMYRGDATGDPVSTRTGWRCDGGPTVLKRNDGTPTDGYGLGLCQHLRARALAARQAVPGTDPCPASRAPTEPPADAVVPTAPAPPTTVPPTTTAPSAPPVPVQPPVVVPPGLAVPSATTTDPPTAAGEPRTARVASAALRVRKGRVALVVRCAKGRTPCLGRVKVRTRAKVALGRRRAAILVLVDATYRVRAGATATARVAPTKDGAALLRRSRRISAVATSTSEGGLPAVRRLTVSR